MRGVILAGGRGTELWPLTENRPKVMIPILGKPIVEYTVEKLKEAGIRRILIVTGFGDQLIRDYFGNGKDFGVHIEYEQQIEMDINGALIAASRFVPEGDNFVLSFGDILASGNHVVRTLNAFENTGADMSALLTLKGDVGDFGVARLGTDGQIAEFPAQKDKPKGHYILAGCFVLNASIFSGIKEGKDLPALLNDMLRDGKTIAPAIWGKSWVDVGRPWDILEANALLLDELEETRIARTAKIAPGATLSGPIVISDNVVIESGAVLRGPIFIDEGTFIGNNTLVREYTSIGKRCMIGFGSEIKDSVIMDETSIYRICYIGASVIGRHVRVNAGTMTVITTTPKSEIFMEIEGKSVGTGREKFGVCIGDDSLVNVNTTLYPAVRIKPGTTLEPASIVKEDIN